MQHRTALGVKAWTWFALWLCMPTLLAAGCSGTAGSGDGGSRSGGGKRIIMLINGDNPFWDTLRSGMEDAERDLNLKDAGLRVEMDKNDSTPKGQIDKLRQYANQTDIAAVAISATDAKNTQIANAMRELRKQGIAVITIDSDVDRENARDARFAYLGTDNIVGGRQLGKAALGLRPEGGKYAAFVGLKSAANAEERFQGFGEGAGERFILADYLGDDMDLNIARKNVRDALSRHSDINTLVGIWAYNAHAMADIANTLGVRDKTTIVTFDAAPDAIPDMRAGLLDAMVVQNPYQMGYEGVRLMKALIEKDDVLIREILPGWDPEKQAFAKPDDDIITTELRVVVPEGSPLKKEMFDEGIHFFTLPEFQRWLDERNLISS